MASTLQQPAAGKGVISVKIIAPSWRSSVLTLSGGLWQRSVDPSDYLGGTRRLVNLCSDLVRVHSAVFVRLWSYDLLISAELDVALHLPMHRCTTSVSPMRPKPAPCLAQAKFHGMDQ